VSLSPVSILSLLERRSCWSSEFVCTPHLLTSSQIIWCYINTAFNFAVIAEELQFNIRGWQVNNFLHILEACKRRSERWCIFKERRNCISSDYEPVMKCILISSFILVLSPFLRLTVLDERVTASRLLQTHINHFTLSQH
jgi:hypothetical protein